MKPARHSGKDLPLQQHQQSDELKRANELPYNSAGPDGLIHTVNVLLGHQDLFQICSG